MQYQTRNGRSRHAADFVDGIRRLLEGGATSFDRKTVESLVAAYLALRAAIGPVTDDNRRMRVHLRVLKGRLLKAGLSPDVTPKKN